MPQHIIMAYQENYNSLGGTDYSIIISWLPTRDLKNYSDGYDYIKDKVGWFKKYVK